MKAARDITVGILVSLAFFISLEFVPHDDLVLIITGIVLLIAALVRGQQLPLMLRVVSTAYVFYWGYSACLVGRTMDEGLSGYTTGMALLFFGLYGAWPVFTFFRLWRLRIAIALASAALPVGFFVAAAVAGAEEYYFVRKYQNTGVGPTPRWTVSNHWLAYDRDAHRLYGSD